MTEEFDRSGVALLTANPTTVYQVPTDTAGATSLVLSCLAAHVADSNATASIELRIVSPAGQVLGTPVRRALIGPGMAVELVPNRHVLGPGERVQAIASSGGLLSILISVLGPALSPNRRGIANVESYVRFVPPETVGSNKNIVNVDSLVEADVTFWAPAIRIGVVVRPPALAVTTGPVVPALAFGAVTIEAPSRSIALSAGVPFVGSAVEAVVVPKAELTLTAAAPVVATGSGVVVPVAQVALSAPVPSVVTTAALDSDAAAYIAAVEAADGQSLEVDVKTAINNFIVGCKADGIWTALKASCILSGARTLSGALVPLVGTAPTNFNFWGDADPHWANVSLLLRMNGANASTTFTDSSTSAKTITAYGNAQISTAQSKFGGASGLFDGAGDYLETPHSADFNFEAGDFTIEFWLRTGQSTTGTPVGHRTAAGPTNTNWLLQINAPTAGKIGLYLSDGTVYQVSGLATTTSVNDSQWHHIAATRSGTSIRLFVDGVLENTATWAGSISSTSRVLQVGKDSTENNYLNGNIDDLRITKGVARYTANFTPPTQTFPGATADYDRKTGLVGDGSTKYLNSNRNNNADPQNSCHISVYASTFGATTATLKIPLGRQINGINEKAFFASTSINSGQLSVRCQSTNAIEAHTSSRTNGLIGASRAISSTIAIRNNNSTVTASQTSTAPSTPTLFVFASSNGIAPNDGGSAANFDDSRLAFYSIGESLNLALLDARVGRLVAETAFAINTGLDGSTYDIDTLKYINAGYAAGGSLS